MTPKILLRLSPIFPKNTVLWRKKFLRRSERFERFPAGRRKSRGTEREDIWQSGRSFASDGQRRPAPARVSRLPPSENQGEYDPRRAMGRNDRRANKIPVDDENRNQFLERRLSAGVQQTLSRIDSCISMARRSSRARYSRKMIISGCLPPESFSGTNRLNTDSGSTTLHACTRPVLLDERQIFLVSPKYTVRPASIADF